MSKAQADGMPQSEASGKSTATAECEAQAARRLSRRRREIFGRLLQPVDAVCGKVEFCAEHGAGVYDCTRPKLSPQKRLAGASEIAAENQSFIALAATINIPDMIRTA